MASTYTAYDQAADLGIHRVHSLVLGDAKKEARIAARFAPTQFKRPTLGKGDIRHEEQQYNWETRMELDRIARRNNLKTEDLNEHDGTTLTEKIASWGSLKVDNAIARPDGLGTGNAHRTGPNYRPIATVFRSKGFAEYSLDNLVAYFRCVRHVPAPAGSVAAAWQAAAIGKQFYPFVAGGHGSSPSAGTVRARSPIRTPARKSIVGSPRQRHTSPPPYPLPQIETGKQATYANQMASAAQSGGTYADQKTSKSAEGLTYADQMARIKALIRSEHALPRPEGIRSQQRSPAKVSLPSPNGLNGSRYLSPLKTPLRLVGPLKALPLAKWEQKGAGRNLRFNLTVRWSGKLATSSDPYFQQVLGSPATSPLVSAQKTTALGPISETNSLKPGIHEAPESTAPSDTAPNTPASITTSAALDIEEYLDLLESEQDEQDELERYKLDPDRLQRDLEINDRVNRSLAEAEESTLAREILSPRTERKTVQFVSRPSSPIPEPEIDDQEVRDRMVDMWNTFRDFVTVRSVTGFEEYLLAPRIRKPESIPRDIASAHSDQSGGTAVDEKNDEIEKFEGEWSLSATDQTIREISKPDNAQTKTDPSSEKLKQIVPLSGTIVADLAASTTAEHPLTSPPIKVASPTPLPAGATIHQTAASSSDVGNSTVRKMYRVLNGRVITVDTAPTRSPTKGQSASAFATGWESSAVPLHLPTIPEPPKCRLRTGPPPVDILRDVEPSPARNTWDMASTPRTEVSGPRNLDSSHRHNTPDNDFLEGLSQSKKVEEKLEDTKVAKKHAIVEPIAEVIVGSNSSGPLISPIKSSPTFLPLTPIPSKGVSSTNPSPSIDEPSFVPLTPTVGHISTSNAAVKTKGTAHLGTVARESKATESKPSPPSHATSALRTGMPVPVPHPPTPRPDIKSPKTRPALKPIIAPKPGNLSRNALVPPPKAKSALSPVVAGLIDPFLQSLQPKAKKASPASRPKTPRVSIDSNDSTPERKNEPSTEKHPGSSYSEFELPSPTSLSSSWTLIEDNKRDVLSAPPSTPIRKSSFGTTPTPAPTPASTPIVPLPKPPIHAPTREPRPTSQSSTSRPRKPFYIVEIPLKDALIPVPVHESDNPQEVAEGFAREHNYEAHCKDGRGGVERLVAFFNATHAQKTKEKEEKRARRRAKMVSS